MSGFDGSVSSEDIVSAYRMFLGREPSGNEIRTWLGTKNLQDLRNAFLSSGEFINKHKEQLPEKERLPHNLPALDIEWQADSASTLHLLAHVRKTWTALGKSRPHWSVLSSDQHLPDRIAANERAFFASGEHDLERVTSALHRYGLSCNGHIFEYGCGIGRVTAHLAKEFSRVTACDISTSHLKMARQVVGNRKNVTFQLVEDERFAMVQPFDIWLSYIVLQHNPPPIIAMILSRMFQKLAAQGLAIFQVPTYCIGYRFNLAEYLSGGASDGEIEVHCLPQAVIFALAQRAGCFPLEVRDDAAMGPPSHWLSNTFIFRKARVSE